MKLTAVAAMAVLAGTNLSAKDVRAFAHTVQICASNTIDFWTFSRAQAVATKMFAGIGIRIQWLDPRRCPTGAIRIRFSDRTPSTMYPGAAAYALPYEGTHIVVFFDRVTRADPGLVPVLLGHVLAHEVTHILEGIVCHSSEGVMKAQWAREDYQQMARRPLLFAQEDVDLIYRGLERRKGIASR
jgi:hypothetical protein